ncbi:hypothetical protein [Mesobacillus maritimus]|uniref:Uncharacterized protein n=1 Tax=Mesobacillus maritimus TaxID=1643336 RepID=A0ABS7K8U9_9BACI|nr:hypothetical protein [Mesobacillus maritimus]MBY0098669.1 hypothetical protein [Mesobacillus maritimus]
MYIETLNKVYIPLVELGDKKGFNVGYAFTDSPNINENEEKPSFLIHTSASNAYEVEISIFGGELPFIVIGNFYSFEKAVSFIEEYHEILLNLKKE